MPESLSVVVRATSKSQHEAKDDNASHNDNLDAGQDKLQRPKKLNAQVVVDHDFHRKNCDESPRVERGANQILRRSEPHTPVQ
jgi:hypothetical protein